MLLISFKWAITSENKARNTWGNGTILSASSEALGYPKENANDGNYDSMWKAIGNTGNIVLDLGTDYDIDYIHLRFTLTDVPTSVKISVSSDNGNTDEYTEIDNTLDGGVSATTVSDLDGTSRVVSVDDVGEIVVGNTVLIDDSVLTAKKYLVTTVGSGYIEIDRYPEPYASGASVTVVPATHCLAYIKADEQKQYVKIEVTCTTTAHIMEICAFCVNYTFDDTALPLNPMPIEFNYEVGQVTRTISGYGVGRMTSAPAPMRFGFSIQRILREGMDIMETIVRGARFGILMDDGRWYEGILGTLGGQRRQSSDSELVSYGLTATFEVI